jgi:MerR family transcriptional regulator, light-induced transcriptional regulator
MDAFTIKDLENLSGIKAHTIRIWEQRYDFLKPKRTDTNIRYYSNEELKSVLNIALLNKYGYKISHINKLNSAEIREKILSLTYAEAQQERIINDLIKSMIDLDVFKFETVIENYILARGIEKTILQIIFPFLEKIGILWQTNHINPAQEHLITNIIRQKIIVGIEGISNRFEAQETYLLFLPEGEHHELGLLFVYFLLKSKGYKVYYLGADVPIKDAAYIVKVKEPTYIYMHLTTHLSQYNVEKFLRNLNSFFADRKVYISGQIGESLKKRIGKNVMVLNNLQEVIELANKVS